MQIASFIKFLEVRHNSRKIRYSSFDKWIKVLTEDYEPLFNVDVKTSNVEHGVNEGNSATSGRNDSTRNTSANGGSSGSSSITNEHFKAAFDASTYQGVDKDIGTGTTSLNSSEYGSEVGSATSSESMTTRVPPST